MVVDKTLYNVLGVEPNATQQTILKAIKKKSLEHHPDRGGSHEMMQQVNAAKEILSDPEKRKIYDQYGLEGMKTGMGSGNAQFAGFPEGLFDLFDLFNRGSHHRQHTRAPKGTDIKHVLKVSLEELYLGCTKQIHIDRDVVCSNCKGTGCHDGVERQCAECEGTGIETLLYRMGPIMQQVQAECSSCHGAGNLIDTRNRCKTCSGKKVFMEKKLLDVNIPHGSQNGETIKYTGEANQIRNGQAGTIYVILKQEDHPLFERNNDDLTMKMEINLTESLCGFQRLIKLLDGQQILINHPPGKPIVPNTYRSMKNYGMLNRRTHTRGDLIIHFDVKFPEDNFITTETQRKQLESILPPKKQIKLNSKEYYEEPEMMEYDIHRENFQRQQFQNGFQHHHHHHETEDANDQFQQHTQHVQCPTQ